MGRTEASYILAPASFRRNARAKKAKATVNKLIPAMLTAHPRARHGIEAAEIIIDPKPVSRPEVDGVASVVSGQPRPRLCLHVADTLTAARSLVYQDERSDSPPSSHRGAHKRSRVAFLNMASPLTPGGGFLNGATSQEESLCMRTTLLPSLRDEYYRLPEVGAVYTPDVLVFRDHDDNSADEGALLDKKDRWFADCISAAMLRQPDTEPNQVTGLGTSYVNQKDRELVLRKMKMVLRICQMKGIRKVVVGAWGCGAQGNPLAEIAAAWRHVLIPRPASPSTTCDKQNTQRNNSTKHAHREKEVWHRIEEVVFAIKDPGMAEAFAVAFGDGLEWRREGPGQHNEEHGDSQDESDEYGDDGSLEDPEDMREVLASEG